MFWVVGGLWRVGASRAEGAGLKSRTFIFFNISVITDSVLSLCRPESMWCDAAYHTQSLPEIRTHTPLFGTRTLIITKNN